ncbi:1-deoxy-D-xylulose 5-phosphate reductoisomerase [Lachnospiraceae bacterium NE2001]|nr:1-deoxy-D-xylulose 5-phosphate reductoisomerase [Lachnospiraceae bacterium NE2001]
MKNISIIGSTGSIGTQALDIVRANGDLNVVALACGKNIELIEKQAREFAPELVSVMSEDAASTLRTRLADTDIRVTSGMEGLCEVAAYYKAEMVLTAIVGMIGIEPTLAAIEASKDIALANKETLVTAGHLVMKRAAEKGVKILPVDSEHSAIFQSLQGNRRSCQGEFDNKLSRILLTASGGPFRGRTREDLKDVTVQQALNHPNWSMGPKITIDSASMVNKGLEVIEAHWLFDTDIDDIQVVIQPQSIIHSAVEYEDGAVIAQLGTPDMKLPIQYAFYYPERRYLAGERLDFTKISGIIIETPDYETFRGIPLAKEASRIGGTMPTVMNEANEHAVAAFLSEKITFLEIYDMIEYAMSQHTVVPDADLATILAARDETDRLLTERYGV